MKKMNFSENLNNLMIENKLSQALVAKSIGVSQRALSKWLRKQAEPTATNLFNLSIFFNVSSDYLLGLSDI